MAEVFRIQGGDVRRNGGGASAQAGRDVLYDYAEAEALWNESDTTAPGPGGALPRAAFLSPVNAGDEETDGNDAENDDAALVAYQRARRWRLIRSRLLLTTAGVLVAGVSYLWGAAGRPPVAVVAPRPVPRPTAPIIVVPSSGAGSTSVGPGAAGSVNLAAQALSAAGPMPETPAAVATVEVAARPGSTVVAASEGAGHRRRGADRQRARRPAALTAAPAGGEWVEPAEPAPRGRRTRLRPIDVTDPFAR